MLPTSLVVAVAPRRCEFIKNGIKWYITFCVTHDC